MGYWDLARARAGSTDEQRNGRRLPHAEGEAIVDLFAAAVWTPRASMPAPVANRRAPAPR